MFFSFFCDKVSLEISLLVFVLLFILLDIFASSSIFLLLDITFLDSAFKLELLLFPVIFNILFVKFSSSWDFSSFCGVCKLSILSLLFSLDLFSVISFSDGLLFGLIISVILWSSLLLFNVPFPSFSS